jgi:hypothetical protein
MSTKIDRLWPKMALQPRDFKTNQHWAIFVSTGRLEPQTAQWGVQVIQVGNFGGSGDFPNFLFYFIWVSY